MANPASHPEGGVDYPRTLTEFDAWFVSETACAEFLGRVRWPEGFRCPSCCGTDAWPTARGQLRCNRCQRQTSVTAGTIFEGTRKPLRLWFQAMWYVTNQKHGVSALGLQRILGLGSYQTAWAWLRRRERCRPRSCLEAGHAVDRPGRRGRGGRNLCGRPGNRQSDGATDEDQVDRRDCERKSRRAWGIWPDPMDRAAFEDRWLPKEPDSRHVQTTVAAWRDRPNRWLVSLQRGTSVEPRL